MRRFSKNSSAGLMRVALDKSDPILNNQAVGVLGWTTDPESAVVRTGDVDIGIPRDPICWTALIAKKHPNTHSGLGILRCGEVVIVTGERIIGGCTSRCVERGGMIRDQGARQRFLESR